VPATRGGEGVVQGPDLGAGSGGGIDLEEHPHAGSGSLADAVQLAVRVEVDPADVVEADRADGDRGARDRADAVQGAGAVGPGVGRAVQRRGPELARAEDPHRQRDDQDPERMDP
jgi:hypothetical protein